MKYRIILQPEAAEQAEQAYLYIARQAPRNAVRWYERLLDAIDSLADFPQRCSLAPEDQYFDEEIRHFVFGNYRILFTIHHDAVRILHVRHAARRAIGQPDKPAA